MFLSVLYEYKKCDKQPTTRLCQSKTTHDTPYHTTKPHVFTFKSTKTIRNIKHCNETIDGFDASPGNLGGTHHRIIDKNQNQMMA